jgi:hypothetical protein
MPGLVQRDNIRRRPCSARGRTEVYIVAERFHAAYADVIAFLCDVGSLTPDDLHRSCSRNTTTRRPATSSERRRPRLGGAR